MELPLGYAEKFTAPAQKGPKIDFEFQALCIELQQYYGKGVWALPHKVGFTERRIQKAHEICQRRGILNFRYLIGVIRKLKPYEY